MDSRKKEPNLELNIYSAYIPKVVLEQEFKPVEFSEISLETSVGQRAAEGAMAVFLFVGGSGAASMISRHHPQPPVMNTDLLNLSVEATKRAIGSGSVYVPSQSGIQFKEPVPFLYCNANAGVFRELEKTGTITPAQNPFVTNYMDSLNPVQLSPKWEEVFIVTGDSPARVKEDGIQTGYITKSKHEAELLRDAIKEKNDYDFLNSDQKTKTVRGKREKVKSLDVNQYNFFMEKKKEQRERKKQHAILKQEIKTLEKDINDNYNLYIAEAIGKFVTSAIDEIKKHRTSDFVNDQVKLDILQRISNINVEKELRARDIKVMTSGNWGYNQVAFNKLMLEKIPELKPENRAAYINSVKTADYKQSGPRPKS